MDGDFNQPSSEFDEIEIECARIGVDIRELGGLAVVGEHALTTLLKLLRDVPTGAGLQGLRLGVPQAAIDFEEALESFRAEDQHPTRTCSLCGRERSETRVLIRGPNEVAICSEYVRGLAVDLEFASLFILNLTSALWNAPAPPPHFMNALAGYLPR